jgi:ATP-dependent DNA helicase RecG
MIDKKLNDEMLEILHGLINNWENEVIEFKRAGNDYDKDKIGQFTGK